MTSYNCNCSLEFRRRSIAQALLCKILQLTHSYFMGRCWLQCWSIFWASKGVRFPPLPAVGCSLSLVGWTAKNNFFSTGFSSLASCYGNSERLLGFPCLLVVANYFLLIGRRLLTFGLAGSGFSLWGCIREPHRIAIVDFLLVVFGFPLSASWLSATCFRLLDIPIFCFSTTWLPDILLSATWHSAILLFGVLAFHYLFSAS